MATYEFYAYFDATQVQGVINAIVSLMGSSGPDGNYLDLLRLASVMGLMMAIAVGYARSRGEDAAHYMIMLAIWYSMLFTPRVPLTIIPVGPAAGAPVVVNNVPIGLAFFASATSKIGHWFTDGTETFFSLPDPTLNFSQHGLMGSTRTLRVANSAAVQDPVLVQSLTNFMRDCINPELVATPSALTTLIQSRSIWADLSSLRLVNPGRLVSIPSDPVPEDCGTAYTNLGAQVAASATGELSRIAKVLSPYSTPAAANTMLTAMLPASEGLIMTASASTAEAIKQRMMINLLNNTSRTMGQVLDDPAAINNALATSIAQQSTLSSYQVMAKLAQETLPIIRNTLELVILGVFPIILVIIILSGARGGQVLMGYVMMMLWVQLWAPLYAIVNYVATLSGANSLTSALNGIDGLAIANAAALSEGTISAEAVAGLLTIAVPVIALALVKGGEVAATSVAGTLMGPSTKAGEAAAAGVASGNVTLGNIAWGNYSSNNQNSNKSDTAGGYVEPGNYSERMGNGASVTQNGRGEVVDFSLPMQTRIESGVSRSGDLVNSRGSEGGTGWKDGMSAGWQTGKSSSLSRDGAMQWIGRAGDDVNRTFGTNVDWAKAVSQILSQQGDTSTTATTGSGDRRTLQAYGGMALNPPSGSIAEPAGGPGSAAPNPISVSGASPTAGNPVAGAAGATPAAGQNLTGAAAPNGQTVGGTSGGQRGLNALGNVARVLPVQLGEREMHEHGVTSGIEGKSSQNTSDSTRVTADNVLGAINQLKGSLSNGQERAAADRLAAVFKSETSSDVGRKANLDDFGSASEKNSVGARAENSASATSGRPALEAAMEQTGHNYRYAMGFMVGGRPSAGFVQSLAEQANQQRPDGGLNMPAGTSEVRQSGQAHVGSAHAQGDAKVARAEHGNKAAVTGAQEGAGLDPHKEVDLSGVQAAYGAVAGEAAEVFASREKEGQIHRGETLAASSLYRSMNDPNMLSIWKGQSYDPPNPQQAVQLVQSLAERSPSFQSELQKSGASGHLTPAANAYIQQEGPKQWDAQRPPTRLDNLKHAPERALEGGVEMIEGIVTGDD